MRDTMDYYSNTITLVLYAGRHDEYIGPKQCTTIHMKHSITMVQVLTDLTRTECVGVVGGVVHMVGQTTLQPFKSRRLQSLTKVIVIPNVHNANYVGS